MFKLQIAVVLVLLSLSTASLGQDQRPSLKPPGAKKIEEAGPSLRLVISYNPTLPPAHLDVRGPAEKPNWIWFTRFVMIPGWQAPEGSLPSRAVRIETQFNGETVDLKLSIFQGQSGFEREELVDKFRLGPGDHKTLTSLGSFGIEPFEITVTDSPMPLPALPVLDIRTSALEITSVEPENKPIPGYRLKLRNVTEKNISAVKIDIVNGVSVFLQGNEGLPLIVPGAVYEAFVPDVRVLQQVGPGASSAPNVNTILVSSAVFNDGTFDGAPDPACSFEAISFGRRFWLKRLIPLLDAQLSEPVNDVEFAAPRFREKVLALKFQPGDAELKRLSAVSPSCKPPAWAVRNVSQTQNLTLVRELDEIISTRPAPPVNFKSWLQAKRELFAGWLARLEKTLR